MCAPSSQNSPGFPNRLSTNLVTTDTPQTITAVKTFDVSPILPTPTTDFQGATKEYVDSTAVDVVTILRDGVDADGDTLAKIYQSINNDPDFFASMTASLSSKVSSSILTTKGDLFVFDGTDIVRVPAGTNGQLLAADSATTNGLKWVDGGSPFGFVSAGGLTLSGSSTNFLSIFGGPTSLGTTHTSRDYVMPVGKTFSTLRIYISVAAVAASTLTFTLHVNGSDTALTVTVPAGNAIGTYVDVTHTVATVAGDLVCLKCVNNGAISSGSLQSASLIGV